PAHANSITRLVFAPDGKTLAAANGGGDDDKYPGTIKVWDVATAKERASIPNGMATVLQFLDLAFSADGKTLISAMLSLGETDKEEGIAVQHWDLATGKARATYWAPGHFYSANSGVYFTALSADGRPVAWGDEEKKGKEITGTAHVWEVGSLATSPPKLDSDKPSAEKPPQEQADKKPGQQKLDDE